MTALLPPLFLPQDWPPAFFIAAAAAFGSMLGSFFNVVIHRMPRGESVVSPPSRCPACSARIKPWENIPVLSWILLRGRCARCRAPISIQYPLVEAATGLWAGLLAWDLAAHPRPLGTVLVVFYFALCAIPITWIDLKHYLIPDMLTFPGMAFALGIAFIPGGLTPWQSVAGLGIAGGGLWSIGALAGWALKKEAMGFGDVKLLALAGACFGWRDALLGLAAASVLGTLAGMLWLLRPGNPDRHIPFGPFLCVGVLLAHRFGDSLLDWYWNVGMG